MQYFYSIDGTAQQGPTERDQLPTAGVTRDTMMWREGLGQWTRAGDLAELADLFGSQPASPATAGYFPQQSTATPQYATPTYGPQGSSGMAIASMVLGIIGVIPCCTLAIPAILAVIFGHLAKSEIRRTGRPGNGMATAGLVLGYVGLSLMLLWLVSAVVGNGFNFSRSSSFTTSPVTSPLVIPRH